MPHTFPRQELQRCRGTDVRSVKEEPAMPRLRRLPPISFGWYYVTFRAHPGRDLVTGATDLDALLELLLHTLRRTDARMHAGCVTSREIHLILQTRERPVHEFSRNFCHRYARTFNQLHGESGSRFQSHPRILLLQHQVWLVRAAHVLHWACRSGRIGVTTYWSSDSAYRNHTRRDGIVTHALLHMLSRGSRDRETQDAAYRRTFDQPPSPQDIYAVEHGSPEDSRILGHPGFVEDVWRTAKYRISHRQKAVQSTEEAMQRTVTATLESFLAVCDQKMPARRAALYREISTVENLRSHSRRSPLPLIRALTASHVIDQALATQTQVAEFFGCHPKTLSLQRRQHFQSLWERLRRLRSS
jgi:hypothetical protein